MRAFWSGLIAALPVAAPAQDARWWQGIWAHDKAWCAQAAFVGRVTPAPIVITNREVLGYENSCVITYVNALSDMRAVQLTLACASEGDHFEEDRLLLDGGDGVMWFWIGVGEPTKFHRCPDLAPRVEGIHEK